MADLATTEFLSELKAVYPLASGQPSGAEAILTDSWYLVAAVAFSASNKPGAVPVVFASVLGELKLAQSTETDADKARAQRLHLARRFRDALLQSALLSGFPRTISSCIALDRVLTDDLRDTDILRDTKANLEDVAENGRKLFQSMYSDTGDTVQALLDAASPDLGWVCNTVGYGIMYGGTTLLTQVEISFIIVAALIAMDAPRQISWHLANAQHGGATLEEAKVVRQISMAVAERAGVQWEAGVPEAV